MDIKHMTYFLEVVRQGSMTHAAETLYIAQPTLSKAIKNMESELDMLLFDRTKRQLKLTDAGAIFYKKCEEIVGLYDNLPTEMNQLLGLKTGHISIGLSTVMNMQRFIDTLGHFHKRYPDIRYNLIENGGKAIEAQVLNDEIDIGITTLPVDQTLFESMPLYKEPLQLVVGPNHRLAGCDVVSMKDLEDEDFIMFNENFHLNDRIIQAAKNAGFVPKTVSKISQWNFIDHLLVAELGVSILPGNIVKMLDANIHHVTIDDPAMTWELGVIWKKEKYLGYATKAWITYMGEHL